MRGPALESRIVELLDMVGMREAQNRKLGGYSKGMQRRVGIAQALINDPEFVILDEPTSGLDVAGRLEVKQLVTRLKDMGKTILLCSHILPDVADLSDRVGILHRGILKAEGTLAELLEQHHRHEVQIEGLAPELVGTVERVIAAGGGTVVHSAPSRDSLERVFLQIIGAGGGGPTIGSPEEQK
jgi:ABC-2 type transport system ATP-binding protein